MTPELPSRELLEQREREIQIMLDDVEAVKTQLLEDLIEVRVVLRYGQQEAGSSTGTHIGGPKPTSSGRKKTH